MEYFNGGDYANLEDLCLTALQQDQLPAFYKAKMYAYLHLCGGKDAAHRLTLAESMIVETRRQHGQLGTCTP